MIGQLIVDRYQVIEILRSGNTVNTYLALDLQSSDRSKCVIKHLIVSHPETKLWWAKKQLFKDESDSLQILGNHSQIPQHLSYIKYQEEYYLIQEFIDGNSLVKELSLGSRWQENQVVQFLKEMLRILEFVHRLGFIHRDIKPSNIIRSQPDNQLVLIDFGAVQKIATRYPMSWQTTRVNFIVGTPGYMPIEQAQGRAQPSSDVYALGMVAIQALTGKLPRQLQENDSGEWIWRKYADVSEPFATILSKMVRYRNDERFQSAKDTFKAIQALPQVSFSATGKPALAKLKPRFKPPLTPNNRYQSTPDTTVTLHNLADVLRVS
ncbi:MAG: serine/threonine-protein kinase [Cyanobacteria bacterium P01_F01_bin.86]